MSAPAPREGWVPELREQYERWRAARARLMGYGEAEEREAERRRRADAAARARREATERAEQERHAAWVAVAQQMETPAERPRAIAMLVAMHYGMTLADILSRGRTQHLLWPRFVAIYLARELTVLSYIALGRRLGGRHHTSIMSAVDRVQRRLASDPEFAAEVAALRAKIEAAL